MKKILLLSLLFCVVSVGAFGQTLLTSQYLGKKTKQELTLQYFFFPISNGVNYYKITYETPDAQGNTSIASALMAVPDDTTKIYPLLCYQHGTSSSKTDVPSNLNAESALPILFAGLGFVSVTPDYLGLGDSPGFHPYVHAATEASAGADALRAIKDFALEEGICYENRVFLTGYSQGGHSSAALHRDLDQGDEFDVVAAAHLSGPYSISVVMRELLFSDEPYNRPAYLINTMFSYQYVYGNLFSDMTEAVKPAYVDKCNQFFNNQISLTELNDFLVAELTAAEGAPIASRIFNDDFRAAVEADPNHPVNLALADNDVYDWVPTAPTRLFYCAGDDQVPFENSVVAEAGFMANGAANIDAVNLGNFDHVGCVTPAVFNTINLFTPIQGTLLTCPQVSSVDEQALSFQVYPNPAGEVVFVKDFPSSGELRVLDMQGRVQLRQPISEGDQEIRTGGLLDGMYFLDCQTELGSFRLKLVVKH
ncbi:MAG: T9SS type A sorting domain-containing protein [Saprospiraceae bacterium]|nr:T9SS type A sorting domain-containing protein [Saprospiraceae bacterium]